nr:uncharacterized protein LOC100347036 [Oryctolagus cuniculus]XP_051694720.1 uncharacterized protein LOC100347036 [Oryctolagus cuniculus]XP_051694721.1 uncharacterized protein LOC100347036 [Oryctolagus cuniculus]
MGCCHLPEVLWDRAPGGTRAELCFSHRLPFVCRESPVVSRCLAEVRGQVPGHGQGGAGGCSATGVDPLPPFSKTCLLTRWGQAACLPAAAPALDHMGGHGPYVCGGFVDHVCVCMGLWAMCVCGSWTTCVGSWTTCVGSWTRCVGGSWTAWGYCGPCVCWGVMDHVCRHTAVPLLPLRVTARLPHNPPCSLASLGVHLPRNCHSPFGKKPNCILPWADLGPSSLARAPAGLCGCPGPAPPTMGPVHLLGPPLALALLRDRALRGAGSVAWRAKPPPVIWAARHLIRFPAGGSRQPWCGPCCFHHC